MKHCLNYVKKGRISTGMGDSDYLNTKLMQQEII
jgi:hypothetical protein